MLFKRHLLGSSITNGFVQSTVQALPAYINDYAKPLLPVTPEHIVIGPGLGSIIAQFMWTVCDEGDGVLITTVSVRLYYLYTSLTDTASRFMVSVSVNHTFHSH